MQITIRYVTGDEFTHEMDIETLTQFKLWLIDDNSNVFIYENKSDYRCDCRCYNCYILKSQIEYVDYSK